MNAWLRIARLRAADASPSLAGRAPRRRESACFRTSYADRDRGRLQQPRSRPHVHRRRRQRRPRRRSRALTAAYDVLLVFEDSTFRQRARRRQRRRGVRAIPGVRSCWARSTTRTAATDRRQRAARLGRTRDASTRTPPTASGTPVRTAAHARRRDAWSQHPLTRQVTSLYGTTVGGRQPGQARDRSSSRTGQQPNARGKPDPAIAYPRHRHRLRDPDRHRAALRVARHRRHRLRRRLLPRLAERVRLRRPTAASRNGDAGESDPPPIPTLSAMALALHSRWSLAGSHSSQRRRLAARR